jgi:hypothetical protein
MVETCLFEKKEPEGTGEKERKAKVDEWESLQIALNVQTAEAPAHEHGEQDSYEDAGDPAGKKGTQDAKRRRPAATAEKHQG